MQVVEELGGHPRETPSDQIQTFMTETIARYGSFFFTSMPGSTLNSFLHRS